MPEVADAAGAPVEFGRCGLIAGNDHLGVTHRLHAAGNCGQRDSAQCEAAGQQSHAHRHEDGNRNPHPRTRVRGCWPRFAYRGTLGVPCATHQVLSGGRGGSELIQGRDIAVSRHAHQSTSVARRTRTAQQMARQTTLLASRLELHRRRPGSVDQNLKSVLPRLRGYESHAVIDCRQGRQKPSTRLWTQGHPGGVRPVPPCRHRL